MNNKELDIWLGKNVMKFDHPLSFREWNPTESISDAFQVVEKMRKEDHIFELKGWSDGWRVWAGIPKEVAVSEFNDSLALAICLAVRKCIEAHSACSQKEKRDKLYALEQKVNIRG